jgi:hypothetical protein
VMSNQKKSLNKYFLENWKKAKNITNRITFWLSSRRTFLIYFS